MSSASLDIVERAYDLEADRETWLSGIGDALRASGFAPMGVFAYEFELRDDRPVIEGLLCHETSDRIPGLLSAMVERADSTVVDAFYRHGPNCGSLADAAAAAGRPELVARGTPMFEQFGGCSDLFVLVVHGLGGRRMHLNLVHPRVLGPSSRALIERWSRVTTHLSAAFRMRSALQESEAVLDAEGRALHCEERAVAHRASLADAVRRREDARATSDDEALEMWRGLVDGRWSLVDHVDTDGKRFVLARPNEPDASDPRALSVRERHVARLLVGGSSTKHIAYDLGLSVGAISSHVHSIQRKLGARNRAHLIAILRAIPQDVLE